MINAVEESGCSAALVSGVQAHPRRFVVSLPDGCHSDLRVYAWTLTHGGRANLPHEYRVQMTSVVSPLQLAPAGPIVLLGYEPGMKMFAGFDLRRHSVFTPGSPSVQIDIRTVQAALQNGLAFDRKSNSEIAVGIRPDQFMTYALNAEQLHKYGADASILRLLTRASSLEELPEQDLSKLAKPRKRIVETVSRMARSGSFRQQVLQAYDHRCAVSRRQLRLVDAAHVLPVGAPGSSDDVRNGIALSPTYHRAFDRGLIYLNETRRMRINPERASDLERLELDAGLPDFIASLGRIHLPPDRRQWPNLGLIRKANRFRRIAAAK